MSIKNPLCPFCEELCYSYCPPCQIFRRYDANLNINITIRFLFKVTEQQAIESLKVYLVDKKMEIEIWHPDGYVEDNILFNFLIENITPQNALSVAQRLLKSKAFL